MEHFFACLIFATFVVNWVASDPLTEKDMVQVCDTTSDIHKTYKGTSLIQGWGGELTSYRVVDECIKQYTKVTIGENSVSYEVRSETTDEVGTYSYALAEDGIAYEGSDGQTKQYYFVAQKSTGEVVPNMLYIIDCTQGPTNTFVLVRPDDACNDQCRKDVASAQGFEAENCPASP